MKWSNSDISAVLRQARAEAGSGHNAFVYVPHEPLAEKNAAELPLSGLPIAVKDVIDCAGMPTAAGSKFSTIQPRNARLIDQLVSKGASVIGKTQAHQFSFGTTGDVSFAGPVKNALDPSLMAGGSSGGSAVAVALGIAGAAVGTDTAGSIRIPAALTAVAGFKPTYGAVSSDGIFPLSPSLDTPGFVARDVPTLVALWDAVHGPGSTSSIGQNQPTRFGVLPESSLSGMASSVARVFHEALSRLNGAQQDVRETLSVNLDVLRKHYLFIIGWEGSMVHGGLARLAPDLYDDEIRQRIAAISGITFDDYLDTLNAVRDIRNELLRLFDQHDVLVSPTVAIETPQLGQRDVIDDSGLDQVWGALAHFTSPWNVVGFPAITLPIPGAAHPAPTGLQLIGRPGADHKLLKIAADVEALLRSPDRAL
jgi:aspartyl-tRNA(Asn)/glutamyl-tRNA(Gln) amidotransferase subunit A